MPQWTSFGGASLQKVENLVLHQPITELQVSSDKSNWKITGVCVCVCVCVCVYVLMWLD